MININNNNKINNQRIINQLKNDINRLRKPFIKTGSMSIEDSFNSKSSKIKKFYNILLILNYYS
jgi:hypothetical protein